MYPPNLGEIKGDGIGIAPSTSKYFLILGPITDLKIQTAFEEPTSLLKVFSNLSQAQYFCIPESSMT